MGKTRQTGNIVSDGLVSVDIDNDQFKVGTGVTIYGSSGIISATSLYVGGTQVTGGGGGGSVAGSDGQIQYNNGGSFGGAAELYYDDSNDRLGIGITNPSETLHLQGDLSTQPSILIKRTYFSQDRELKLTHAGSYSLISDNTSGINFALSNQGATPTTQVSMQYGGVGIGTDNPQAKLDVDGTLSVSGTATFENNVKLLDSDTLSFGIGEDFKIGHYFGNNAITMVSGNLSLTDSSSNERLKLTNNGDWEIKDNQATTRLKVVSTGATVTGDLYATTLYGDGSNLTGISTYSDSSVDSHLNQSNPTSGYVLSWNGTDYAWVAQSGGGGGTSSLWTSTGYTGIGTISAVGIGTKIEIIPYDDQDGGTLSFEGSAGNLFSVTNNLSSGSIFAVNDISGSPSIDVNADGTVLVAPHSTTEKVGIGTLTPAYKLHVVGDTNIDGTFTVNGSPVSGGGITSVIQDTSPSLGGNLDVNTKNIVFSNSSGTNDDRLKFGSNGEFQLYYDGGILGGFIESSSPNGITVKITGSGGEFFNITDSSLNSCATFFNNGAAKLYWRGASGAGKKLETTSSGVTVTGNATATSFVKSGGTSSQYLMADGSVSTGGGGSSLWTSTGYTGIGTSSAVGIGTKIEIIPYDDQDGGTLSFEGSAGNLLSITNNLSSGSIFAVNDISGAPSIDVNADGTVSLNGTVEINGAAPATTGKAIAMAMVFG